MEPQKQQRRQGFFCLALLCLVAGSRWLLEGPFPQLASTSRSEGVACVTAALLYATAALRRGSGPSHLDSLMVRAALGTAYIAGVAVLAQGVAGEHLAGKDATLALLLAPLVVAVARPALEQDATHDLAGALWPSLASVAGLLLLLPEPALQGVRAWLGLSLFPVLVGIGAVLVQNPAKTSASARDKRPTGLAAGCALAGLLFLPGSLAAGSLHSSLQGVLGAAALDAGLLLLSLECLRRLGASTWSAQFLLVPLLALLESLPLLRPSLDARSWMGLGLLTLGAVRQVWPASAETDPLAPAHFLGRGDHF